MLVSGYLYSIGLKLGLGGGDESPSRISYSSMQCQSPATRGLCGVP